MSRLNLGLITKPRLVLRRCHFSDGSLRYGVLILTLLFQSSALWGQSSEMASANYRIVEGGFHLEFAGPKDWDYDIERKDVVGKTILELRVPKLSGDAETLFSKIKANDAVESIFLEKPPGGAKDILTIYLKNENIESFDYLTEKPSRLIVDFYEVKNIKDKVARGPAPKKVSNLEKSNGRKNKKSENMRKPASDEFNLGKKENATLSNISVAEIEEERPPIVDRVMSGIFDGGDPNFERFNIKDYEIKADSIIRSEENLYIPFPMREMDQVYYEEIKSRAPFYEIIPKETDENKMARLVLTLFQKNRLSVALKTSKWFIEKYPNSEYGEIISFIDGDIYFKRWNQLGHRTDYEMALQSYREAMAKYPTSLLSLRTEFIIAYSQFENKDFFGALKTFQKLAKEQKSNEVKDRARLGEARSLLKINQYPDAVAEYELTQKSGVTEALRSEASYLKGDVFFTKKDFSSAVESYSFAIKKYPSFGKHFPSGFYNLGESLFWLKRYKEGLDAYRDYLTRFPRDSHAAFAMTRIGEILEILGADQRRSNGAFLEAYFRYGGTSGAAVSRMRLLSHRMGEMKVKEAQKAINEIEKIVSEFPLPQIDLLATILIAEGQSQRGEYVPAISRLLNWYQTNASTRDVSLIKKRITRHVNEEMETAVNRGQFFEALKIHNQYADLWLRGTNRIDTIYNLARAFELAGAYKPASTLFLESINKLIESKANEKQSKHSVFEHLPTIDQVNLRLAKVYFEMNQPTKAFTYINEVRNLESLSESEQVERMEVSVELLREKGDFKTAKVYLRDLIKNWQGRPTALSNLRTKLAKIEIDEKSYGNAIDTLIANRDYLELSQKVPSKEHLQTLELLSSVYGLASKTKENEKNLTQMLETYGEDSSIGAYRYKLGKLFFDAGNIQKASETWKSLDETKDKFWSSLAKNYIRGSSWESDYKKYIQRIPAMEKPVERGRE